MLRRSLRYNALLALILLLAGVGLYAGWRLFWFLTDDAYIAFRYISNAHLGYGYVWNAPPFKPVEGYTSFLWVALLDIIWRLTGVEPPESANVVSLIFSAGTLLLTALMVLRLRLGARLERYRLLLLALVLFGMLSNRTFLAWTSSGLETAMFNFWLTAWVFAALSLRPGGTGWLSLLAGLAVLMGLTRPDGLVFMGATLALIALGVWESLRCRSFRWGQLAALSPFAVTGAHLAWRQVTYGEWLPNTYLAKYVGPWPESGWRYLLSFTIEYSLWFWLALAAAGIVVLLLRARPWPALARRLASRPLQPAVIQAAVVGALAAHFAYYTFIIGGDHFEYRVYSHLVPLLLISFVWLMNALSLRPAFALGLVALSLAASLPIPWTHWALSQRYTTRLETWAMRLPVAPYFPGPLRAYVAVFDSLQDWLIQRAVCVRHQEHKLFSQYQFSMLPPRADGLLLSPKAEAVRIEGAVGAVGWALPTVSILDAHGLNDLVIARTPLDPAAPRLMAHDRIPPEGYLDCFQANTTTPISKFVVAQRKTGLDSLVPACESRAWPAAGRADAPDANLAIVPAAGRVLDNVWTPDPLFIDYVPPGQAPVQPATELLAHFEQDFHDTGCLVYPPPGAADGYQFAFLPPNLRYAPEELEAIFPWASMVDFARSGGPRPYSLAYALPADGATPEPPTPHQLEWGPAGLLGFRVDSPDLQTGGLLETELYFRTTQAMSTEQWFRLSLTPTAQPDTTLALDQADPCRGMYPAPLWEPGQVLLAKSLLPVPADLPPGDYALRLDMFDLQAGPDQLLPAAGDGILATLHVSGP